MRRGAEAPTTPAPWSGRISCLPPPTPVEAAARQIELWHQEIAEKGARPEQVRPRTGSSQDGRDRRGHPRAARANRILTVLKAALSHA